MLPPLLRFACIFLPQFSGMERVNPRAVLIQVLAELPEADVMLALSKEEIRLKNAINGQSVLIFDTFLCQLSNVALF